MTLRTRIRLVLLTSVVAVGATLVGAQQAAVAPPARQATVATTAQNAPLSQDVPVDPLIRVGTLPNGLRYYVRANRQPQARAELRLAVNAGSVLEDDDQRGLAHFVEHMSFNGTTNFPGQQVTGFMQSLGMRFGAHVNAHTTFDETVYELQVPTDNPAVIDRSLRILEDWAHNVTFDAAAIERERGVILEEWRLGLGADERLQDAQFPLLLNGSRYAERLPIGRPDIIRNANPDRLKQFYKDWYRPDLISVVAVGDFDAAAVEAQVRARFGGIPTTLSPKPKPASTVPDEVGTRYSILTDPETTATRIGVYERMPAREQSTIGAYRQQMVERLFSALLSARLGEIAQKPDAPFLAAQTDRNLMVTAAEMTTLEAVVTTGGVERGLAALFTEVDRVARFGFTQTELDRQRLNLQRFLERAVVEKDKNPSGPLADEFIRNFIRGEPIPGIVYEYGLNQRFLPQITLAEVNKLASDWVPNRSRLVLVSAPEKDRATLPTQATLMSVVATAGRAPLTPYVDAVSTQPLLPQLPAPGSVAKTTTNAALGITEWQLSNGVRVVLKPTTFKQDEIMFRAVSAGGASLASDEDLVAAETAGMVASAGGLGGLTGIDLNKLLAGTTASVSADIGETEEGVAGGAARKDLTTMFQLIYLTFTAPRADPVAFRVLKDQLKVRLANEDAQPDSAFARVLNATLSQNHPRTVPLTAARVDQMDLDKSIAFYKSRFGDASAFTFVFVGSFDLATMQPLVERYLGSLPVARRSDTARDNGVRPPTGVVEREVRRGIEPKSQVSIVFTGPFQNDEMHRVVVDAMAAALSGDLFSILRQGLGGTYGVSVEPAFAKRPVEEYRVTVSFACDPARTDSLVRTALGVIEQFKNRGPADDQVDSERVALARDFETNSQRNEYLLNRLMFKYEFSEDVNDVFNMRPFYDRLTSTVLRDAARAYLNTDRYVRVTLLPETTK